MPVESLRRCPVCGGPIAHRPGERPAIYRRRKTCGRCCGQRLRRSGTPQNPEPANAQVAGDEQADEATRSQPRVRVMDDAARAKAIARRDELARRLAAKYGLPRLREGISDL